jgi:hypothetical protein
MGILMKRNLAYLSIIALGISSCTVLSPTPTSNILADSFFSGYAYVDANGNGQLDPADTPLKDANFIVHLKDGTEFGALTDATGNAFVTIPSAVQYPVSLSMKPPLDSTLKLIGPAKIILDKAAGEKASFLFSSK